MLSSLLFCLKGWMKLFFVSFILFAIFLVLKLTAYIAWSWLWITSPLWIYAILYVVHFILSWILFKRTYKDLFGENTAKGFITAWDDRKNK